MTTWSAVLAWTAATGMALAIAWGSAPARAQEAASEANIAQARAIFAEAEQAYDSHRYATAADLFRQVHDLMAGHPRQYLVLFNLGQCLADAGQYAAAIDAFERYLAEGGDRVENRGEVEQRIRDMRELMGETDGGGGAAPVVVTPAGPDEGLLTGSIVAFGVGGLGLVAMGVFGGLALAEHDALADGCGATTSCSEDDIATSDTFALVADISLGVGAAGVAAGLALLIAALTSGGSESTGEARLEVAPWATPNGFGATGVATW